MTNSQSTQLPSKAMDALAMSARSLLRQAQCPECHHNGMQGNRRCNWCAERAALMDGILSVQPNAHETCDGRPPVPGLRYDVVGWACSVCGAWNGADEDFCAHPNRPKGLLAESVAMARAGAAEDLKDLPHALKAGAGE